MCHGRSQELNGADSAQGLADAIAIVEGANLYVGGKCAACSERAKPDDIYCVGHARLGTYTAHESAGGIAANE